MYRFVLERSWVPDRSVQSCKFYALKIKGQMVFFPNLNLGNFAMQFSKKKIETPDCKKLFNSKI